MRFELLEKDLREKVLAHPMYLEIKALSRETFFRRLAEVRELSGPAGGRVSNYAVYLQKAEQLSMGKADVCAAIERARKKQKRVYALVVLLAYVRMSRRYSAAEKTRILGEFREDPRRFLVSKGLCAKEELALRQLAEILLEGGSWLGIRLRPMYAGMLL